MFFKFLILALVAFGTQARPQVGLDDFNQELENNLGPVNPNPQYTYSYQVASDEEQTYLAHNENRDGDQVTGQYSYVDANGALVTVVYQAGPNGYTEERTVQDNFIEIRARPVRPQPVAPARPVRPLRPVAPARPAPPPPSNDNDLVAQIIAQLTPFIRETVSNSLGATGSTVTTTTTQARRPAPRPVPVAAAPLPVRTTSSASSASGVQGIFGVDGANNVRVDTPDFNFAYDLRK